MMIQNQDSSSTPVQERSSTIPVMEYSRQQRASGHQQLGRNGSNTTPEQARLSMIPMMTEPDPCPFEQAQSSEEGREQDIDLLADVEDDYIGMKEDEDLVDEITPKRLSLLYAVRDSDQCPSKEDIIGQDMVEPMDAPLMSQESCEDDANVSEDGTGDVANINRIGITKEYNLMLGFNHRQTDTRVPQKLSANAETSSVMIEATKGEKSKEFSLDRVNFPVQAKKVGEDTTEFPEPELSVTPRDWTSPKDKSVNKIGQKTLFQDLAQNQIFNREKQASVIESVKQKQMFDKFDVSSSLQARRTMRQAKVDTPLTIGGMNNSQSQSFSRQIQDLNLETKLKNLQDSISHLPNKVQRTRSNASKKREQTFHVRGDNSIGGGASMDLSQVTPKGFTSSSGYLGFTTQKSSQRVSMPLTLDHNAYKDPQPIVRPTKDPFQSAEVDLNILLTAQNEEDDNQLLLIEDLINVDDETANDLLLLNDDNMSDSCEPPEFGQVEDMFQRSQLVIPSRPMIVEEVDRESEGEKEETKEQQLKVPQKLHEFRKQAAAKDQSQLTGKTTSNSNMFSNMRTDFSMTSKSGSNQQRNGKNTSYRNKLSESQHSKKSNNLFGQRIKKPDVLPNAPPQRSRLETLALPKSCRPAEQLEQIISPNNAAGGESEKPKHMFRAKSNKSSCSGLEPTTDLSTVVNSTLQATASVVAKKASVSPRINKSKASNATAKVISPKIKKQSPPVTSRARQQTVRNQKSTRQTSSPEPQKRIFNNDAKNTQSSQDKFGSSFASAHRLTLLPMHNASNSNNLLGGQQSKNSARSAQKQKQISQIALYKDQQPIISLRKRYFTAVIQAKHSEYAFRDDEFDVSEHPLEKIVLIQCPICKRNFEQGVFGEIHNQNNLCRRVFIQKRLPFDSLSQRVAWDEEMLQMLQLAKTSINFSQRNKLNPSWEKKRQLFKKYSQVHQSKTKAHSKKIDKLRMPVIFDPENPTEENSGDLLPMDNGDHSLFMNDISMVEHTNNRSYSMIGNSGLISTNKIQEASTYMDFEIAQDASQTGMITGQDGAEVADERVPCDFCGRKFNPDVSLKHVPICQRNYEKKHGPISRRKTMHPKKSTTL